MGRSLSKNAEIILEKRYLKKDRHGNVSETPENLFERVAGTIAAVDGQFHKDADVKKSERKFFQLLSSLWFMPNSPTLMNAGGPLGQLAACFVLPVEDSMDDIFETVKQAARIHKSGGGTGFSFSRIRPANDIVHSTAGVSSGPIPFMTVFDTATETVKQGGTRRGANMGILRVDHPDIEAFIESKNNTERLNNFNISVALTDAFMTALDNDCEYDLVNPRSSRAVSSVSANRIFAKLVSSAWMTGEPGVIFIDEINRHNPTPRLGEIESTNPCGEQPLLPYESCTLGSINLSQMVTKGALNMARIKRTVHDAIHFLDNVIDANRYPLPEIEKASKQTRKIGLGIMGFADMLTKLGIQYDSEEAVQQAESLMACIQTESRRASALLAEQRGNFPAYEGSIFDQKKTPFMRNATTTTIAPTGTISIIAGASSGIEPFFAVAHKRRISGGQRLSEMHPLFVKMAKKEGFFSKEMANEVTRSGSIASMTTIPDHVKRLFRTAHDISPEWHIRVQAAFQKYTDNAVSKTVNFSSAASQDDVEKVYRLACATGCKGITIYRDGSRDRQVLDIAGDGPDDSKIVPRPRPERTHGVTERIPTGCGKLYVTLNSDESGMCEVFAQMGKTGGCASSQIEAAGRLISLALRSGVEMDAIIKQIIGIRCPNSSWQNGKAVLSCPDAIAQVLKNMTNSDLTETDSMLGVCPECSDVLVHAEGCLVCHTCGFSKCN
jgi:ribonucleoside-diphosphate reductase alpha chain